MNMNTTIQQLENLRDRSFNLAQDLAQASREDEELRFELAAHGLVKQDNESILDFHVRATKALTVTVNAKKAELEMAELERDLVKPAPKPGDQPTATIEPSISRRPTTTLGRWFQRLSQVAG